MKFTNLITCTALATILLSGCSAHSAKTGAQGAAAGAVGSAIVSSLVDLIVSGRINTTSLAKAAVGGALVGGAVGTVSGIAQDKEKEKYEKLDNIEKKYSSQVGSRNAKAIEYLVECRHKEAYTLTLDSLNSKNSDHKLSAIMIEALIDKDLGNVNGVNDSIERYMELDNKIETKDEANLQLDNLYIKLLQERASAQLPQQCNN